MHENALAYVVRQPRFISFAINFEDENYFNQLRFIVHLETKFRAEVVDLNRYHGETGDAMASVELEFPGLAEAHDARQMFADKTDACGRVKADFVGAFERSDPKAMSAKALLKEIEAEPFAN